MNVLLSFYISCMAMHSQVNTNMSGKSQCMMKKHNNTHQIFKKIIFSTICVISIAYLYNKKTLVNASNNEIYANQRTAATVPTVPNIPDTSQDEAFAQALHRELNGTSASPMSSNTNYIKQNIRQKESDDEQKLHKEIDEIVNNMQLDDAADKFIHMTDKREIIFNEISNSLYYNSTQNRKDLIENTIKDFLQMHRNNLDNCRQKTLQREELWQEAHTCMQKEYDSLYTKCKQAWYDFCRRQRDQKMKEQLEATKAISSNASCSNTHTSAADSVHSSNASCSNTHTSAADSVHSVK